MRELAIEEVERHAAASWPSVQSESLGDWKLRATYGVTKRANSVLTIGEPSPDGSKQLSISIKSSDFLLFL
ncbi:GNAT family N-acetyltransferase, cg3035/Rv0428c family [Rossellomorea sp. H39__3]